jgi:NAD(P)-dependent dehydrogenase (short-subunit alcohol dehydrogenase family)
VNYTGRTALVTGAGRNIGRSIALAFAEAGIAVAVNVRSNKDEGEAVAAEARALGATAMVVTGDIANADDCTRIVEETAAGLGQVDYLVCSASPRRRAPLPEISVEEWDGVIRTGLSSTFYLSRLILPGMADRSFGRVIAIAGAVDQAAVPNFSPVVAAKHGLLGLVRAIAVEFGDAGITANAVSPGWTDTSRDPVEYPNWPPSRDALAAKLSIPRLGQPSEIAAACLYLASDEAAYITGQDLHVNGGIRMA